MLTLTIRPVGAFCNARCSYCYHDDDKLTRVPFMSSEILETLVKSYQSSNRTQVNYVWHGGEPTLAGISFYETAISLQKRNKVTGQKIINTIQTNAWAINDDWALFFKRNKFHIGISLDGPAEITDTQRGKGYFDRCMRGIGYLQKHGVSFSIICVVTNQSIPHAKDLFHFFILNGIENISFNPVFGDYPEHNLENPDAFGEFMKVLYDEWLINNNNKIQIRFLKESTLAMLGGQVSLCAMQGGCQSHLVIEHDGTIQPCHVDGKHKVSLGNIIDTTLEEAATHTVFSQIQHFVDENCTRCKWYKLCGGDCVRFISANDDEFTKTPFCSARKAIFSHIENDLLNKGYINTAFQGSSASNEFKGIPVLTSS